MPPRATQRVSARTHASTPPHIDDYRFGHITIDGVDYAADVIVRPDGVRADWRRRTGHRLAPDDLADLPTGVRLLIVGTGASGRMAVPQATRRWLGERGVALHVAPTGEAVALYNERAPEGGVAAALHLTC